MSKLKILTLQAVPGMIVAEDVYTQDFNLIIPKDTALTDRMITRLNFYSIYELHILVDKNNDKISADFIETTYYEDIKQSESFVRFHQAYQITLTQFEETLDQIAYGETEVNPDLLLSNVNQLLKHSSNTIELFNMLHCMRQFDTPTYVHSLNVALICNIIGKWLNFTPKDLEAITLAGLLHDLGKLLIPNDIISKPSKLTDQEYSTVKTHALRGFELLKSKNLDLRVKYATLMHHERCDGTGYPYGFMGDQIDPFAKLVAIADVYDAMSCARVYRGPICPFDIIHIFETEGFSKYDPKYVMTFLEGIAMTYIHNTVKLSNQQEGKIIMINKFELSKPVIMVNNNFVDLSKSRDISIVALL